MNRSVLRPLALAAAGLVLASVPLAAAPPTRDYFHDRYTTERVLDWGERPVWSFDGKRIAFTVDDENLGPAYEMDVATRQVHCLTCRWGASGYVARIYYLADGSYLVSAAPGLETAEATRGAKPQPAGQTMLYWMPADASTPPQPLGAVAVGEVAIDYDHSPPGTTRLAWGEFGAHNRILMGNVVNDGKRAWLVDRTVLYANPPADPTSLATFAETYDFIDGGQSVLFFTKEKGRPYNGMYKIDIASGKLSPMPTDGQHNETHSFPDVRFGLEESNRASDPTGPYRGLSGHRGRFMAMTLAADGVPDAEALSARYGGKPFDLYLVDWNTGQRRRLSQAFDVGGEAHQSSPARDGARIVYAVRPALGATFKGQPGLYIGTFSAAK